MSWFLLWNKVFIFLVFWKMELNKWGFNINIIFLLIKFVISRWNVIERARRHGYTRLAQRHKRVGRARQPTRARWARRQRLVESTRRQRQVGWVQWLERARWTRRPTRMGVSNDLEVSDELDDLDVSNIPMTCTGPTTQMGPIDPLTRHAWLTLQPWWARPVWRLRQA